MNPPTQTHRAADTLAHPVNGVVTVVVDLVEELQDLVLTLGMDRRGAMSHWVEPHKLIAYPLHHSY